MQFPGLPPVCRDGRRGQGTGLKNRRCRFDSCSRYQLGESMRVRGPSGALAMASPCSSTLRKEWPSRSVESSPIQLRVWCNGSTRAFQAFSGGSNPLARSSLFRGSSAVEQSAVNRLAAGSNPAPGAIHTSALWEQASLQNSRGGFKSYRWCQYVTRAS